MPLIKQDALPISRDELASLRADLKGVGGFRLLEREDSRPLFLGVPREEPDPVADLEDALDAVPDWAALAADDVFLVGTRTAFHVPSHTVRPVLERRRLLDEAAVAQLRNDLDPHFGMTLLRIPGDPPNVLRLGLRIPRATIQELGEAELQRIALLAGPLADTHESDRVRLVYLVAERDHFRLSGSEFFADIEPRYRARAQVSIPKSPPPPAAEPASAPPAPTPAPSLEVPVLQAPPAAPARRRPTRVINIEPVFELESQIEALPPEALDQSRLTAAANELITRLRATGFELLERVQHAGAEFDAAAERRNGYPRRLVVKTIASFGRTEAERLIRHAREMEVDLLLVVAGHASDEARRRCLASRVKVITPDEVASVSL